MKIQSLILSLFCICSTLSGINWQSDIDQSQKEALKQQKPLIIYFSASWCIWCQKLERDFLSKPAFEKLADQFIFVKINYPQNRQQYTALQHEWRQKHAISTFPQLIIISSTGKTLGKLGFPRDSLEGYVANISHFAKPNSITKKSENIILHKENSLEKPIVNQ
jgi:thioredoxin-related protein